MSVALALCAVLAACGSSSQSGGEDARIRDVINHAVRTRDAEGCHTRMTQRFLEQTEMTHGSAAMRKCQRQARVDEPAHDARITAIHIGHAHANARVALHGGDGDGASYELRLAKDSGGWKLDEILSVDLAFERWLSAGRRALVRAPRSLSAQEADCVVADLRSDGKTRVEQAIVAADAPLLGAGSISCISDSKIRRQFEAGLRSAIPQQAAADCIVDSLRSALTSSQIRQLALANLTGNQLPDLQHTIARAALACRGASSTSS